MYMMIKLHKPTTAINHLKHGTECIVSERETHTHMYTVATCLSPSNSQIFQVTQALSVDSTAFTDRHGSHSLACKNSRTFQDPQKVFPGLCHSPAMLNYRETAVTYFVYTVWQYNPSQNVRHKLQKTVRLAYSRNTSYIYLYTVFNT